MVERWGRHDGAGDVDGTQAKLAGPCSLMVTNDRSCRVQDRLLVIVRDRGCEREKRGKGCRAAMGRRKAMKHLFRNQECARFTA